MTTSMQRFVQRFGVASAIFTLIAAVGIHSARTFGAKDNTPTMTPPIRVRDIRPI